MEAIKIISKLLLFFLVVDLTEGCPSFCECIGNYHGLKHVTCVGKKIIGLEGIPKKVEWLRMSNNSVSLLPNFVFKDLGLTSLIELDLDFNSVRSIGLHAFEGLRKLQAVDLRYNHLRSILPYTFGENEALKVLLLAQNPLGFLREREPFLASASLEILDLSGCRIGHLPAYSFGLLPSLKSLNLSYNQLVTLDEKVFAPLTKLETVDLTGNPIICDSHIKKISVWLKSLDIEIAGSPCKEAVEKPKGAPKMFEKLQVLGDVEDVSLEKYIEESREHFFHITDVSSYDGEETEDFNETSEKPKLRSEDGAKSVEIQGIDRKYCHRVNLPLIITLTTSGGFLLGGMFILCLFYIKTNCRKSRRTSWRRRSRTSFENSLPPIFLNDEQPPPPYYQVASRDHPQSHYTYDEDLFSH